MVGFRDFAVGRATLPDSKGESPWPERQICARRSRRPITTTTAAPATRIAHAEAICAERRERLTPMRRRVLEALLASHAPLGAYELIDRLPARGARPAPITIYRALDFLREQGLVHRIESRNAFIACVANHASGDPVVFLICEKCGAVGEAASAAVAATIKSASRAAGFTPEDAGDRNLRHLRALQSGVISRRP